MTTSQIAKELGFTHVAHYTAMSQDPGSNYFNLISKTGKIDTPEKTGKHNFEFEEYNNEKQVFLALVDEKYLDKQKHYGSVVLLFDLTLLDKRVDYFINTVFTGMYSVETGAQPSDSDEHKRAIMQTILKNEYRNEVVFQNAIDLRTDPLVKIVLLGGSQQSRSAMCVKLAKYYNPSYANYNLKLTPGADGITVNRV